MCSTIQCNLLSRYQLLPRHRLQCNLNLNWYNKLMSTMHFLYHQMINLIQNNAIGSPCIKPQRSGAYLTPEITSDWKFICCIFILLRTLVGRGGRILSVFKRLSVAAWSSTCPIVFIICMFLYFATVKYLYKKKCRRYLFNVHLIY